MGAMYLELSFDLGSLDPHGLMEPEAAYVTDTYAACFDVARFGDRDGWVCLAGRRR